MPREKSKYRERRSSSSSSESSYERKKSKSKHKRRSRSRDRSVSSHKRKRSSSRSKYRRRSVSRSKSRDKYESRSRKRSSSRSRSKKHRRSVSRDYSRSPSRSRSRDRKQKKSRSRRSRSSDSSRSGSIESERRVRKVNLDDTETKVEKAIKAAEAAGLTMTKIPTYEYKEVEIKEDMPTIHDRNLLAELNSDSFVQKTFTSSKSKKQKNIAIDLDNQTINIPETENKALKDDSIIDSSQIPSDEELREMWVRKLYLYRKKMLKGEL